MLSRNRELSLPPMQLSDCNILVMQRGSGAALLGVGTEMNCLAIWECRMMVVLRKKVCL